MVINMLINNSIDVLEPRTLFQSEVEEGLVKIHLVADTLDHFKYAHKLSLIKRHK